MTRRTGGAALCAFLVATLLSACGVTRGDDGRDLEMLFKIRPAERG